MDFKNLIKEKIIGIEQMINDYQLQTTFSSDYDLISTKLNDAKEACEGKPETLKSGNCNLAIVNCCASDEDYYDEEYWEGEPNQECEKCGRTGKAKFSA